MKWFWDTVCADSKQAIIGSLSCCLWIHWELLESLAGPQNCILMAQISELPDVLK